MEKFNNILQAIEHLKKQHSTKAGEALTSFYKEFDALGRYTKRKNGDAEYLSREKHFLTEASAEEKRNEENKIKPLDAGAVVLYWCGAYVDDIDEHTRKFYEAREALKVAEENAKKAREVYNDLTRGNMKRADGSHGFPAWIF